MPGGRTVVSFSLFLVMTRWVRCSCLRLPSLQSMMSAQCHKGPIESIHVSPEASAGAAEDTKGTTVVKPWGSAW